MILCVNQSNINIDNYNYRYLDSVYEFLLFFTPVFICLGQYFFENLCYIFIFCLGGIPKFFNFGWYQVARSS